MATWHQERGNGLAALYAPHPTGWKVISDRHGEPASSIVLESKDAAERYVANAGGSIIPPAEPRA